MQEFGGRNGKGQKPVNSFLETETGKKRYSVGIYARLSVDANNEKNESIETQIQMAECFLQRQPDMCLFGCYSDLGKSGTDFDREGFNRLMADVRLRKVNCIIVKDFSRFGRNYIETGNYIQKIFPFLGVRFISITDRYDSLYAAGEDMGMNLKNLANELYARDIASKVKSSRMLQWEKGSYTGGIPPYGYRAEWIDGKKRLFAEAVTSKLVKEIYRLYEEGLSLKELAEWLYGKKVHRPSDYRRYGHVFRQEKEELREWTRGSIKLILTNPAYIGWLVQARTCGRNYRLREKRYVSFEDWSIKENTHEALVTQEQFFRIAERFEKQAVYGRKNGISKEEQPKEDIFAGLLYCGDCQCRMARVSSGKELASGGRLRIYGYFCRNASRVDSLSCEKKYIGENSLTELIKKALSMELILRGISPKNLTEYNRNLGEEEKKRHKKRLTELKRKIGRRSCQASARYIRYRSGEIGREGFTQWNHDNERKTGELREEQILVEKKINEIDIITEEQNRFLRAALRGDIKEISKEMLHALVEQIRIFADKRVEIIFRFSGQEFSRAVGETDKNGRAI